MAIIISANVDSEVYLWLAKELASKKFKNMSKLVNFYLRKQIKEELAVPVTQEVAIRYLQCKECGSQYSSKLNFCPQCAMAEAENEEEKIKELKLDKEKTIKAKEKRLGELRASLEVATEELNRARGQAEKVNTMEWATSKERVALVNAQGIYNRTIEEIVTIENELAILKAEV